MGVEKIAGEVSLGVLSFVELNPQQNFPIEEMKEYFWKMQKFEVSYSPIKKMPLQENISHFLDASVVGTLCNIRHKKLSS